MSVLGNRTPDLINWDWFGIIEKIFIYKDFLISFSREFFIVEWDREFFFKDDFIYSTFSTSF